MKVLASLLSFCLFCNASQYLPERARGGLMAKLYPELLPNGGKPYPQSSVESSLSVPLDHFDPKVTATFEDKYYTDATYFDQTNGPIFIHMGGEGGVSGVRAGEYEREHRGLALGIEHRFYGHSIPNGDRSVKNLKYLSVEQNLADTIAILDHVSKQYGDKKRVVVSRGGSYSGATSAWLRVAYPDKVHASYSSSGVVNAIKEMTSFDDQIAIATSSPSPSCTKKLIQITGALERAFKAGKGASVKKQFGASNLVGTKMGDSDFWYMVADGEAMADQYGRKQNLSDAIAKLGSADDELIRGLASWIKTYWGSSFASGCFYDSECLKDLRQTGMDRSWRWQKCTELGYLQSAPATGSIRGSALTIEVLLEQCTYVFGDSAVPATDKFNAKFGGDHPKGSKIMFLNYSDDPWQRASVNKTLSDDLIECMTTCDGCGHCGSGVPSSLHKCSDDAKRNIAKWMTEAKLTL